MNKTYRTVFNTATGTYVAASELARGRKKGETALALVAAAMLSISGTALAADADDEDETDEDKPVVSTLAPRSIGTNSMIGIRVANEWGAAAGTSDVAIGEASKTTDYSAGQVAGAIAIGRDTSARAVSPFLRPRASSEVVNEIAYKVISNDVTITFAARPGSASSVRSHLRAQLAAFDTPRTACPGSNAC